MLRVEGQVLLVVVVRHAQAPYLVGGVGEPGGVDVDAVVHLVAQQRGLAVDADGRVLLRVLLGGLDDRRLVLDLVGRGDAVVDGQRGLVVDGLVGGRVLVHLGLEAQQHARVGAGLPVGGNPVLGERGLERVVGFVPLHLVGALRDDAAGSQVGDLQGLLVRGGVLGIGVAQLDGGHRICLVRRDPRVHAHGVFHGLAGEHGLGVDAGLVAALGGFGDDLLVDRGHGHADLRRVGVHRAAADRLAALVVEVVALRVRARVELVALRLAVGFEQLHGVEVHVEGDHDADLLRGLQVLLRGLVGVLRADRDLGALGGDVELVGHVPAGLVQVVDAGVGLVGGVLLVDLDVGGVLQVEDAIDVGEVVGPRDLGHAAQSCGQGAGDDRRHLVAETVVLVVAAHLVALGRIDGQLPLAADLHGPRLVGVGRPHEHRRLVGRSGLVVPLLVRLVGQLDLLALGGTLFDGARQVELDLARAVLEHRLGDVRSLRGGGRGPGLPVDRDGEVRGLVLAVDEHLAGLPVDPLDRTGQIIGDGIGCQRVEQVRGDAAVDDHAHLVAHQERLLIDALLVGPIIVLGDQSAGLVQHPHLVRGRRDLAHAVAVTGLAVGQAAGAVVSVPARHGTVVDLVVAAGRFRALWHVQRVEAGMRGGGVRLDHALAIDGIVDGNVRRHDVAVRVGHGHLAHVVLLGAADHHVPGVDRVVDPELAGGVGMRLDVRRVQRTGRDGVVAVPHRVAGPVGQPFLGRGGGLLAGLLAVVLSLVGDRLGHVALLRHVNVPPALARRPRLPRGVHVLEGRAHCGAALVGCGELLRHRLLGAVNATPVQGRGAVHVLGLRPVGGQADRVRSILGVARLARHLRSLRADAQMIGRRLRLVLVQHDHHDRRLAGSLHITTHNRIHAVRRIIREAIGCVVILSACIFIGVRCDVGVPVVVPATGPGRRSHAGPVVDVVAADDGWHRADRDHSAVAVALAGVTPLETGLAFRAGLVQCGLRLGDAVALQSDAGIVHGGAHRIKTRGRTPSARSIVLVLPELHRGQVAARAGLVAAATARERGRCDDAAGTKRGDRSHRRDTGLHHLPAKVHVNEPPLTLSVHPLPQSFRSWPRRLFSRGGGASDRRNNGR
ncbi:Uncharacterised protein [Bifidobacterium pseudocatenulatum]|uniref:Uncharacterized protein n=1 Tax=Bifidobacterium pseudocatenulatum TaxID=28026 RepID=A0AAX3IU35_BIFPS|nr:Uncharacterised protein [Bifidobacterium pseudocatenulatum]